MTVKELLDKINKLNKEIQCDGNTIASHKIKSSVIVSDTENRYEIVDIQPTMLFGCGCWDGIDIIIKKVDE
jgi:hypothetical protein